MESTRCIAVNTTSVQRSPWEVLHGLQDPGETGSFILSHNLLRNSSPRTNAFYWFGFFLAEHGFAHKCFGSSCIPSHLAEITKVQSWYQKGSVPSTSFICAAEEGYCGSFWSNPTTAWQIDTWERSGCNLIHFEQIQWHLRVYSSDWWLMLGISSLTYKQW